MHTEAPPVLTKVAGPFEQPWALAFLPDGRMLVTEKHSGRLRIVSPEGTISSPVAEVPDVDGGGQGGLLDVSVDRDHAANGYIYLSYYEPRDGGNGLAVARAVLNAEAPPALESVTVIFRMQPTFDSDAHAGGRMAFSEDGHLFVTLGDRQTDEGREQARDLGSHLGKIVRIHSDGSVPEDNPFVGRDGARPEIWSLGHRNVLGADWDPVISPGALTICSGDLFPEWDGDFLIAGLSSRALMRVRVEEERVVGEERLLTDLDQRLREVVQGPDGAVYVLTDGDQGELLKLTPGASP